MKYTIAEHAEGIEIKVTGAVGKEQELISSFRECREGRCSCPTEEYAKLESLDVSQQGNVIVLHLKVKSGETLKNADIERCLQYTAEREGA